jgi:hypothetical protein
MKPIGFEDANANLTHPNENVADLPAWTNGHYWITRWRLSWRERLSVLLFGNVWVSLYSEWHPPIAIVGGKEARFERPF